MSLKDKGKYIEYSSGSEMEDFLKIGIKALKAIDVLQEKYSRAGDTDSLLNEIRDTIVAKTLGYPLINTDKHGFDAKKVIDEHRYEYLEIKQANYSSKSLGATFNDTTYEKAKLFEDGDVALALGVWKKASELELIVYGKNKKIGEYLRDRIDFFKSGQSVRSTQTLSISKLVFGYGLDIIAVNSSVKDVHKLLCDKHKSFKKYDLNKILTLYEYRERQEAEKKLLEYQKKEMQKEKELWNNLYERKKNNKKMIIMTMVPVYRD